MRARIHKLFVGLALAAALSAPAALAQSPDTVTVPPELSYIQAPGGNNDLGRFEGLRGGPTGVYESQTAWKFTIPSWLSQLQQPGTASDLARFADFRGGPSAVGMVYPSDWLGHDIAAPGGVGLVGTELFVPQTGNTFDWADAGVGAGFVAGIALLAGAGLLALRRRRPLAHA